MGLWCCGFEPTRVASSGLIIYYFWNMKMKVLVVEMIESFVAD
jgi:hypothetical protein